MKFSCYQDHIYLDDAKTGTTKVWFLESEDDAKELTEDIATCLATLTAERDRLAAENVKLRKKTVFWKQIARLEFRKFRDWKNYGKGRRDEFFAANATLDKLREAVPEDDLDFDERHPERDFDDLELAIRSILYPENET